MFIIVYDSASVDLENCNVHDYDGIISTYQNYIIEYFEHLNIYKDNKFLFKIDVEDYSWGRLSSKYLIQKEKIFCINFDEKRLDFFMKADSILTGKGILLVGNKILDDDILYEIKCPGSPWKGIGSDIIVLYDSNIFSCYNYKTEEIIYQSKYEPVYSDGFTVVIVIDDKFKIVHGDLIIDIRERPLAIYNGKIYYLRNNNERSPSELEIEDMSAILLGIPSK